MTLNGHFSRPAQTDPYGGNTFQKGASYTHHQLSVFFQCAARLKKFLIELDVPGFAQSLH